MTNKRSHPDLQALLAAVADGELDVEQAMERLAQENAGAVAQNQSQERFKAVVARSMAREINTPDALRASILAIADGAEGTQPANASGIAKDSSFASPMVNREQHNSVLARIGRWAPAAVAAVLFLGTLTMLQLNAGLGGQSDGQSTYVYAASLIDDTMSRKFKSRHTVCATDVGELIQKTPLPNNVEQLPGAMADYFGTPQPDAIPLDLSVMGYEYSAAGNCNAPGKGALHVVYHAKHNGSPADALSLWVRPVDGNYEMAEGRVYRAQVSSDDAPVLAWTRNGLDYFLHGDNHESVETAAVALRFAARK